MEPASGGTVVCKVCLNQYASYTCPRCNTRYCSAACYKAHSARCTEEFYREEVEGNLRGLTASAEQRAGMQDILRRLHAQQLGGSDSDDSEGGGSEGDREPEEGGDAAVEELAARLLRPKGPGGQVEVDTSALTPHELAEFEAALARGEVSPDWAAAWSPWWRAPEAAALRLSARGTALVRAADGVAAHVSGCACEGGSGAPGPLPAPPSEPLPPLSSLLRTAPSPLLRWGLLEALYAYCLVMCLYVGDWADDPGGAGGALLEAGAGLSASGPPPSSAPQALSACIAAALRPSLAGSGGGRFVVQVVVEVGELLKAGRGAVLLALVDAARLADAAAGALKAADGAPSAARKAQRRALQAAARKLHFYAAWANEQAEDLFYALHQDAAEEAARQLALLPPAQQAQQPGLVQQQPPAPLLPRGKVVIEELPSEGGEA